MAVDECPQEDLLLAFSRGDLSEEAEDAIADHIDVCARCEAKLTDLEHPGANASGKAAMPDGEAYTKENAFQEAAQRVRNIGCDLPGGSGFQPTIDIQHSEAPTAKIDETIDSGCRPVVVSDVADVANSLNSFGDYELIEEIARGGMGVVYKARQTSLNRIVALKMILAGQFAGKEDIQRFHAEAEAAANLDHPGIVPVFEVGEHDGRHYFTMGFVNGASLANKLKDGPLPPRDAAKLTRQVAEAVAFAHQSGVIHRDLKPANILIDDTGRPKVTDFGLAKRVKGVSELTATGQILGTPDYMPPEQAAGELDRIGPHSDLYSLGAVLYCCLTGRPPFQAASMIDTLTQVLENEPVGPRSLNPNIDRDLETICLKCLHKQPERRYASAGELSDDLGRWAGGEPIQARRATSPERLIKWARRRPAVAGLLFASMLALLFLGGVAVAMWDNERLQVALDNTSRARQIEEQARLAETQARSDAEQARELEKQARVAAEHSAEREATARIAAETAEKELRRTDYLRRIALARLEWQSGRTGRVDELLKGCPPEWRGWEWRFLQNLNHQESMSIDQACETLAYSHDGKRLYTGNNRVGQPSSSLIQVRDPENGTTVDSFGNRPNTRIWQILPSGDDSSLTVVTEEQVGPRKKVDRIERWNASTGEVEQTYYEHEPPGPVNRSPFVAVSLKDGSVAAALRNPNRIVVWDPKTKDERHSLRHPVSNVESRSVVFSPNGELLVAGFPNGDVFVWNAADGELVQKLTADITFHSGIHHFLGFDPAGQRLVMTFGRLLQIWNTSDWSTTARIETGATNTAFSFNATGEVLAVIGHRTTIDLRETESGRLLSELHGHFQFPRSVAFTPAGSLVSVETAGHRMKFWNPSRHRDESLVFRCDDAVKCLSFSPDGLRLAAGGGRAGDSDERDFISIRDAASGEELFNGKDHFKAVRSLAFTPDGNSLVTASWDHSIGVWDLQQNRKAELLNDDVDLGVEHVAISPSGRWFASAGGSRESIRIWDRDKQEIVRKLDLTKPNRSGENPTGIAFSPDGRWFASAFLRTGARVWSTKNWELQRTFGTSGRCLAFSRDSAYLAEGDAGGSTTLWNVATGESVRMFLRHKILVTDVSFNEDDSRLATSSVDGTVKIWDTSTGQELLTLTGHAGVVTAVTFSPNGQLLATGGQEGTVHIYDGTPRN